MGFKSACTRDGELFTYSCVKAIKRERIFNSKEVQVNKVYRITQYLHNNVILVKHNTI